jgi:hypothetical protein
MPPKEHSAPVQIQRRTLESTKVLNAHKSKEPDPERPGLLLCMFLIKPMDSEDECVLEQANEQILTMSGVVDDALALHFEFKAGDRC